MYKICVFAGTTEGRELIEFLSTQNVSVTACVATEYGETLLPSAENLTVSAKRLPINEIITMLQENGFDLVIDATHPYAASITRSIGSACAQTGTEYLRLLRGASAIPEDAVYVENVAAAVDFLSATQGNILLTTGSKELASFADLPGFGERVYARVLPMESSLESCRSAGLKPAQTIAMQGPFSQEMNAAMLRFANAKWLVTKDGGDAGGFEAKAVAARKAGARMVVIGRPPQRDGVDYSQVIEMLCKRFGCVWTPNVSIVSLGPGNRGAMTAEAETAIRNADCLIGAGRMLDAVAVPGQAVYSAIAPQAIADFITAHREYRRFAVVMSGDAGFFSGAKKLLPVLNGWKTQVIPGLSSLVTLCARLQTSYEDVYAVSLHGRDHNIVPDVRAHRRVFALVGGENGIGRLCGNLTRAGLGSVTVHVGQRLSYPDEKIISGTAASLAAAMVVRACEYDMSQVTGAWPANVTAAAQNLGLYRGLKDFDPEKDGTGRASRGDAAIVIHNGLKAIQSAAADGYAAARRAPEGDDGDGTGGAGDSSVKSLSIEEAVDIMQTTGILAETAQLNQQSDKNALKSAKESISSINSILKYSDMMPLDALYQAQQAGATESNRKLAQLTRDFIEANLDNNFQAEMNGIEQTTRQLYYGLLQAQENEQVCRESVAIEEELLAIAKQKHSLGMLSDLALSSQEYSLTSAKSKLSQAEQTVLSTRSKFNMLMNLPTDTELVLTTPLTKLEAELPTLDEAIDSMMNNSLQLKQINYGIEAAEIQYKSLRYTTSTSSSTYKKAETAYQNAVTGFAQAKSSMKTDMQTAYFELADLETQIDSFASTIALTEKSLAVQETQLNLGMTTVSEINQTKLKLQQANQGLTNAIATYNTALTDFYFSMGIGTERISFS